MDYQLTDWFPPSVKPTIPGKYRCRKAVGAFECDRVFNGEVWLSPMDDKTVSPIQDMDWRGVVPDSISLGLYPSPMRIVLRATSGDI